MVRPMDERELEERWLGDAAPDFVADTRAAYNYKQRIPVCPFCRGSGLISKHGDGFEVMAPCTCQGDENER